MANHEMIDDPDVIGSDRSGPDRRRVLVGAAACGLLGVLAACDDAHGAPAHDAQNGVADAPTTGAASSGAAASGVLAAVKDVPVGGGIVANGVLVVQPTSGSFKAFDAACPHRGVQVKPPENGISTCPAHHSTFAIADGARLSGPATQGLTPIAVKVDGSDVVRA